MVDSAPVVKTSRKQMSDAHHLLTVEELRLHKAATFPPTPTPTRVRTVTGIAISQNNLIQRHRYIIVRSSAFSWNGKSVELLLIETEDARSVTVSVYVLMAAS